MQAVLYSTTMKVYVINSPQFHVERANLLFCLCPDCGCEINWRHVDASYELYASCCVTSFKAHPVRNDLEVYLVQALSVPDFSNVRRFPKKVQPLNSPPTFYG